MRHISFLLAVSLISSSSFSAPLPTQPASQPPLEDRGPWSTAWKEKKPMTADEAKAFMKRLAQFVHDNHLKRDEKSAQRGMTYEYLDMSRKGQPNQFVQGEALDTMHDGAWLAVALVNAYRATGDRFYKDWLTDYTLPFYLKMLNHSDTLFSRKQVWVAPTGNRFNKEHALQEGEKGFVPYWWDDGASVSLERPRKKQELPEFEAFDQYLADGKPNPEYRLSGYSIGSSNHLAQDLGLMLMQAWLLLRESAEEKDRKLTAELVEAAKNLQQCRTNHGSGNIPAVVAPLALMTGDPKLLARLPDPASKGLWEPSNHYTKALRDFKPGQRMPVPGFADDQQYRYYSYVARAGGKLPDPAAFKVIYDAYTEGSLYRLYSDDAETPPGINVFDLHPYFLIDGKFPDYRSDRKGPAKKPRPIGSRMGPQQMVCVGWALQLAREREGLWEKRRKDFGEHPLVRGTVQELKAALDRELAGGLRTWEAIFDEKGFIPTGLGTNSHWDRYSDTGGYAHLISATAQYLLLLDGKNDWEMQKIPAGK